MLILVVEDDVDYADIIAELLRREGYAVVIAGSLEGARRVIRQTESIAIAVLDVMLTDGSGLDFASELRQIRPQTRFMFLTGVSGSSAVMNGFQAGADDYITKPFHPAEFMARIRVIARRASETTERPSDEASSETPAPRGIECDRATGTAYFNGVALNCTPLEFRLLRELVSVPEQVLTHAYLNDRIWQYWNLEDGTLLKGHVSSLRRKIKECGGDERMIRTVHGVGYAYVLD